MSSEIIHVSPLSAVAHTVERSGIGHLITLINDQSLLEPPRLNPPGRHLRLVMNDISEPEPGMRAPSDEHVAYLIEFIESWDRKSPMLIHCWAGISRSTAGAFIALCTLNPGCDELIIARALRKASRTATPNRRLVQLGDAILGRDGRMTAAVDSIGRGELALEADPFHLPARITA